MYFVFFSPVYVLNAPFLRRPPSQGSESRETSCGLNPAEHMKSTDETHSGTESWVKDRTDIQEVTADEYPTSVGHSRLRALLALVCCNGQALHLTKCLDTESPSSVKMDAKTFNQAFNCISGQRHHWNGGVDYYGPHNRHCMVTGVG